jgi:hypothetical protein
LLSKCRISGSFPTFPIKMTLLTDIMYLVYIVYCKLLKNDDNSKSIKDKYYSGLNEHKQAQ